MIEGLPLGNLATDPTVLAMCGGVLPTEGVRPFEVLDISAIRIGKSLFAAALVFWLSQVADLSGLRKSDICRIFIVALKTEGCQAVMKHLLDPMLDKSKLRALLADDPDDITLSTALRNGLHIKRSDGKVIEVKAVPLDKGGGSGISVFSAGVIVDEYPRMAGSDDGVKNIDHFRDAVYNRIVPGGMILETGSPWQPYGPAYDMTIKHFGKPSADLLVLRTSAQPFVDHPDIKKGHWTTKRVAQAQRQNPIGYKTDFLAEFADGEQAVFPAQAIEDAVALSRTHVADIGRAAIFADPSALRHDYWAAMVGRWVHPILTDEDLYEVEQLGEHPTPGRGRVVRGRNGWIRVLEDNWGRPVLTSERDRLKLARPWFEVCEIISWDKSSGARGMDLVKAVGDLGRKYGCEDFHWDGYEQLMLGDLIRHQNLRPVVHTWSGANRKTEAVDHLRTLFVERRVKLPQHEMMKQELQRFRARPTPGGNFQYVVAGGAGHGDHASCLTLAMRADLDGYVDRSPTAGSGGRHTVYDYEVDDADLY